LAVVILAEIAIVIVAVAFPEKVSVFLCLSGVGTVCGCYYNKSEV